MNTVGILSLVQGDLRSEALRLWRLFDTEYDSRGVRSFAHPNLTFQAGLCADSHTLQEDLARLASQLEPFPIIVDGLGFISTRSPVVHLRVQKTRELETIHETVDRWLAHHCETRFKQYLPPRWIPHITVAMQDLTPVQFARAQHALCAYAPHFAQTVSNLQLVLKRDETGQIEIVKGMSLGIETLLSQVKAWAGQQPDIDGVLLVGSHARGTARPDSDVDLVILTRDPGRYLASIAFATAFGPIARWIAEDWGRVTSQRVWYFDGLEVEFSITRPDWTAEPLDPGTRRVLSGGVQILFERDSALRHLRAAAA